MIKMLLRQVGANDLRTSLRRCKIDINAFPAAPPIRISEEASQYLRIKIALAFEVGVEGAPGQSRLRHDGIYRDTFKSVSIKQPAGTLDNSAPNLVAMTRGIRHSGLLKYDLDHILEPWFNATKNRQNWLMT